MILCKSCDREVPEKPGMRSNDLFKVISHVCKNNGLYVNGFIPNRFASVTAWHQIIWCDDSRWVDLGVTEPETPCAYTSCQKCLADTEEIKIDPIYGWVCVKCFGTGSACNV